MSSVDWQTGDMVIMRSLFSRVLLMLLVLICGAARGSAQKLALGVLELGVLEDVPGVYATPVACACFFRKAGALGRLSAATVR